MSTPHAMPTSPPTRRTPLIIALACGCALLLVLVLVAVGVGVLLIGSVDDEGPEPTTTTSPSAPETSSSPTEGPPTELDTDQPVDKPTEGPSTSALAVDRPVPPCREMRFQGTDRLGTGVCPGGRVHCSQRVTGGPAD